MASNSLQNGKALLLIDGLDEIAEDKNRLVFTNQLRIFIATYPMLNIIITSRETGFRVVAGALEAYCDNYTISNLSDTEIEDLCMKWHKAIIDSSDNTIKEAKKLSEIILNDVRIKVLAGNPLLLTTLLFVKRWAGYLPTKKSILYQEMIKLLLVTWNVEGHEMLDIEEAEPQLAFIAYWMTKNGQQTITVQDLKDCLIDARKQMPEILGYTNISPAEFIKRVESRSSLLIMSGHKQLESGSIVPIYEFLHLSFQEYLSAKAIVKRFIPESDAKHKAIDIIKSHINDENWKEVIPLTAVLLERNAKELIEYLVKESQILASRNEKDIDYDLNLSPILLGACLANEVQVTPDLLGKAIEWYAKNKYNMPIFDNLLEIIIKNKFGTKFKEVVKECFFNKFDDKYVSSLGSIIANIFISEGGGEKITSKMIENIDQILKSDSKEDRCTAILGMMHFSFRCATKSINSKDVDNLVIENIHSIMTKLIKEDDPHYNFTICWCIAWSSEANFLPEDNRQDFIDRFIEIWTNPNTEYHTHRVASWALSKTLMPFMSEKNISRIEEVKIAVTSKYNSQNNEFDQITSVYLGTILGMTFNKDELYNLFNHYKQIQIDRNNQNSSLYLFMEKLNIPSSLENIKKSEKQKKHERKRASFP